MNSINVVIFFALIAAANCMISDNIYDVVEKQCNQSRSLLKPLNLDFCNTAGNRGTVDLLCHGIASAIVDICSKTSNIKLEQSINSTKLNDLLDVFCSKANSVKINPKILPTNVSESLKKMNQSTVCSWFCEVEGHLNPICPFLVAFAGLKNNTISKKNISNAVPVVNTAPANVNDTDKQETVKKEEVPKPNQPVETDDKNVEVNVENELKDSQVPSNSNQGPVKAPAGENKPPPVISNPDQGEENPPPDQNELSNKDENVPIQPNNGQDGEIKEENQNPAEDEDAEIQGKVSDSEQPNTKISPGNSQLVEGPFVEAESGNFFAYFIFISALCMFFYVAMYNKKKILALLIEGRRTNVKRRPNSAAYSKLDCTLEEAMASGPSTSSSNTILY